MRLARPRFAVRRLMVAVGVVAGCFGFIEMTTNAYWVGFTDVPFQFTVLDDATGKPISGASVRLGRELGGKPNYQADLTGAIGRTTLIIRAMCSGHGPAFHRNRGVAYWPWRLYVESGGYQAGKRALEH